MALVLIGFMGAGKSTLARRLARLRGTRAIDSDAILAKRFGHSVTREFDLHGEPAFRAAEEEIMGPVLDDAGPRAVIALGGGSVLSRRIRDALAKHQVALLDVDVDLAWERVHGRGDGSERPLARDRDAFAALHAERRDLYEQVADARLLWAASAAGAYPVFIGDGLLDPDRLATLWPLDLSRSRPFCVTDTTVYASLHASLHASRLHASRLHASLPVSLHASCPGTLGLAATRAGGPGEDRSDGGQGKGGSRGSPPGGPPTTIAIEPGETHKTLATAEQVWSELAAANMTRADHLVALGGGVVGDLAGFCAATYQRGVPIVHIPTTLVAQVDSAYGGKTGVDLPAAKNYVGAYHQPAGVLVDPTTLATLPPAELAAGWVEVLKTALIAGGQLWERVAATPGCLPDARTIRDCAATKLAIVAADERDSGARQALNLGHTIGHAIETATHYTRYRHGEAIGLGLLAALRLSDAPALRAQVRELLRARDLPVTLDGARAGDGRGNRHAGTGGGGRASGDEDKGGGERTHGAAPGIEEIVAALTRDKKRLGEGGVPFVLLSEPGEPRIGCQVTDGALRAAVAELGAR